MNLVFAKIKKKKDGLQSKCKECRKKNWGKEYKDNKKYYIERRKLQKENGKLRLKELKDSLKCALCPENTPCCLEFHHLDPNKKDFTLGLSHYVSDKTFLEEINKCLCVCSNCHRKLHANIISYPNRSIVGQNSTKV